MASYCQESTRYCKYSKDAFGSEITVIRPSFLDAQGFAIWKRSCEAAEIAYFDLPNGQRFADTGETGVDFFEIYGNAYDEDDEEDDDETL